MFSEAQSDLATQVALVQKLEFEIADHVASLEFAAASNDATVQTNERHNLPVRRRHILVREFTSILRRLDTSNFTSADLEGLTGSSDISSLLEIRGDAAAVVSAAWAHYSKIRVRSNASDLISQIPMPAICLLITELAFMSGSKEYRHRFERIIHIFNDFSRCERPIQNPVQFGMYLRALNKLGRHQLAIKEADAYFSHEANAAIEPKLAMGIKRQTIVAYFKGSRPDMALAEFQTLRANPMYRASMTPHVYSTFLSGALRVGSIPKTTIYEYVDEMLDTACSQKYPETSRTGLLNELLHAAHKAFNQDVFFRVFERSLARDIKLNYTTFGILINFSSVSYATDARQFHKLYKRITASTPNLALMTGHIFAIFANSFVRMGRIDYALSALNDLREHPTAQITTRHFISVFAHYAKFGMARDALDLYHTMVDFDKLQVPWKIWMYIIRSVWNCNEMAATSVETTALDSQAYGDDKLLSSSNDDHDDLVISIIKYGRVHDIKNMLGSFSRLRSLFPESVFAFTVLFNEAHRIVARDAWKSGMSLQYDSSRHAPSFVDDSWRYPLVDGLRRELNCLIRNSARLDIPQELYNRAISVFAMLHEYQTAQMLYSHMISTVGMEPTKETFDALLSAFVRGSDMDMATDVVGHARRDNVPVNSLTANALIHGYFATNQPEKAVEIYAYISGRPLPLHTNLRFTDFVTNAPIDTYTYVLLISKLIDLGNVRDAIIVFDDSFTLLRRVPNRLLTMLVAKLEECMQFDLAQLCLRRYSKRVHSDSLESYVDESLDAPDRLPISYFGYLLDQTDNNEQ
ncbi:hypothetical protein EV175_002200 [Coemansia sp. RSA 1933]|nr:hypothetical protein EV175_002200 [Coemansia sp. RSA 1933]